MSEATTKEAAGVGVAINDKTLAKQILRERKKVQDYDPTMQALGVVTYGGYDTSLEQVPLENLFNKAERHELASAAKLFARYGKDSTALQSKYKTTDLHEIKLQIGRRLIGFTRQFLPVNIDANGQVKYQVVTQYRHAGTDGKDAFNDALECVALSRRENRKT